VTSNPEFKVTPLVDVECLRKVETYALQWSTNRDLHTPYWRLSISDDLE